MPKKIAKKAHDKISFLIESAAELRNLYFKETTIDKGRRVWKLSAGTSISTEIAAIGNDTAMACIATPIVSMGDYEIHMPTNIKIESDIETISEWITPAIVKSLERADSLLEILTSVPDVIKSSGYGGRIKSLQPIQRGNDLFFPFLIAEQYGNKTFLTEICIGIYEHDFVCSFKTKLDGAKRYLLEKNMAQTTDSMQILESIIDSIDYSRTQYNITKDIIVSQAYAALLDDPGAYDGKVVLFIPKAKIATNDPSDK
jgi:hypothetical protein